MEQKDIIINGVSVNQLKAQRAAIREGASKLIAENIETAKNLTKKLVESEDSQEIETLAKEAYEALDTAQVVSGVSGVSFFLPFYEEYGSYNGDEIFSNILEESENELVSENWDGAVSKLYRLFGNMESQSRDWHSSRC
jgi:hypothetical protein